jgi:hypothetical protein
VVLVVDQGQKVAQSLPLAQLVLVWVKSVLFRIVCKVGSVFRLGLRF